MLEDPHVGHQVEQVGLQVLQPASEERRRSALGFVLAAFGFLLLLLLLLLVIFVVLAHDAPIPFPAVARVTDRLNLDSVSRTASR